MSPYIGIWIMAAYGFLGIVFAGTVNRLDRNRGIAPMDFEDFWINAALWPFIAIYNILR